MKASLLFVAGLAIAISSIALANAAPANPAPAAPWRVGCSWAAGWRFSPTCRNLANFKTYTECTTAINKQGNTATDAFFIAPVWGSKTKKIISRCAEAAPQSAASFISGQARDAASWHGPTK